MSGLGEGLRPVTVRVPARIDFAGGWSDVPDFSRTEGGAVLNAAIDCHVEAHARWDERGFVLEQRLDLPPDSHLGTSSSSNLAYLELIAALTGRSATPVELAERTYRLEMLTGNKGGKQDGYAAALGGVNLLRFGGEGEPAAVEPLRLAVDMTAALEGRLILVHSGRSPDSGKSHAAVWRRYGEGDRGVADTLRAIRDTVRPARDALAAGDWDALGRLMTENRELARRLSGGAVTERMDALFAAAERAGALGSKPCGAGGGGCVLILCGDDRGAVERALRDAGAAPEPVRIAQRRERR